MLVKYASEPCGYLIYTCLDELKLYEDRLQRPVPTSVCGEEEGGSAHGAQQQGFLIQGFDNVRAPSRLLCEVLLTTL